MSICLMVATEKGYCVLKSLNENFPNITLKVVSFNETGMQENYAINIQKYCFENKISFSFWSEYKKQFYLDASHGDFLGVICIGWRYLINPVVNQYLKYKIIVFHDSLLPRYRGFAPLPTAIIKGDNEVGVTVLYGMQMMDSGQIILQESLSINSNQYIREIIKELTLIYIKLANKLINLLINEHPLPLADQLERSATYSCWRDEEDYLIDWSQSNEDIYNMIRALSYPYKGAASYLNGQLIRIYKATLVEDINFALRYPGKVWCLEDGFPVVICGKGMLRLEHISAGNGERINVEKLRTRFK